MSTGRYILFFSAIAVGLAIAMLSESLWFGLGAGLIVNYLGGLFIAN